MTGAPSADALRSDANLKEFTAELRRFPDVRSLWGHDVGLWQNVVQVLESRDEGVAVSVTLLQFLNNLTASNGIGSVALPTGFLQAFARAGKGSGNTERRLYWQILANFTASFDKKGSYELDQAIDQVCPELPLTDAIASNNEVLAYPCLVFMATANTLITSMSAKLNLNITSGALGTLLDVLPLWFEGGEEKDQCIKAAKDIFELCVASGAFANLMKAFEHNDSRELTLYSMFDAVITSSSFAQVTTLGRSWFVRTDAGRADMAAICSRLEQSINAVMELIPNANRTAEECFVAGQRTLKLLDIVISLLSSVKAEERNNQRYLIPALVQLLIESKKLPSISKLGSAKSFDDIPVDDRNFPHLKTYLLMALAVFVENDFASQEEVRKCGGLAAVLECCVIDANNPFMKERAIVCLRYLLKGNEENQNFVASLEARQVADPDALAQAGYEATITDGKLSLKPRTT